MPGGSNRSPADVTACHRNGPSLSADSPEIDITLAETRVYGTDACRASPLPDGGLAVQ